jgi:hypothetical protein
VCYGDREMFLHTHPVRTRTGGVTDASVHHAGSVEIGKKLRKCVRKQAPRPRDISPRRDPIQ